MEYTNWHNPEPNGERGENYLTMYGFFRNQGDGLIGLWNDVVSPYSYDGDEDNTLRPLCQYF